MAEVSSEIRPDETSTKPDETCTRIPVRAEFDPTKLPFSDETSDETSGLI
jgi:hypothetical protein